MVLTAVDVTLHYAPTGRMAANYVKATGTVKGVGQVTYQQSFLGDGAVTFGSDALKDVYQVLANGVLSAHRHYVSGTLQMVEAWEGALKPSRQPFFAFGFSPGETGDARNRHVKTWFSQGARYYQEQYENGQLRVREAWSGVRQTFRETYYS